MSREQKILLGVLSGANAVAPILTLPVAASLSDPVTPLYIVLPLILFDVGLSIFYVWFVDKASADSLLGEAKWPWVLLVIFGGGVGQIVFWYLNIWQTRSQVERPTSAST